MPLDLSPLILLIALIALVVFAVYAAPVVALGWAAWKYRGGPNGMAAALLLLALLLVYGDLIVQAKRAHAANVAWCQKYSVVAEGVCSDAN